jgi:CheY-like chemotaxis protein
MKTILVVEDERTIAEILSVVLQDEGFHVVIADNGKEGFERLAEDHPDLVLCDVMMPIVDGRDMVRAMAADPDYSSIPVVMMSAASLPPRAGDYSYAAFIRKPFDLDYLISTIHRVLHVA